MPRAGIASSICNMGETRLVFESLGEQHDRAGFSCGAAVLDRYFQGDPVRQDISRRLSAAFVMTPDGSQVAGFYTLSSLSVASSDLPEKLAKRLPMRLPVPATLLGRMGVALAWQGKGAGAELLLDALHRASRASHNVASLAVVVDAKESARGFYQKHDFIPLPASTGRMFLLMGTIEKLFRQ